jgi:hypothetical protein
MPSKHKKIASWNAIYMSVRLYANIYGCVDVFLVNA